MLLYHCSKMKNRLSRKNIILNEDGIQNEEFIYTPKEGGEKNYLLLYPLLPESLPRLTIKKCFS